MACLVVMETNKVWGEPGQRKAAVCLCAQDALTAEASVPLHPGGQKAFNGSLNRQMPRAMQIFPKSHSKLCQAPKHIMITDFPSFPTNTLRPPDTHTLPVGCRKRQDFLTVWF